jgi:amino acid transporter
MSFRWLLYLHLASVLALLGTHGASMTVLYRIRRERDRRRILDLVTLSGETIMPMYISLAAIVVTGVLLGLKVHAFSLWWIWAAIVILVVTAALMGMVARPYFARVKEACQMRPSGVPRVSDEELGEILRAPTAHVISAIGVIGLLAILYLMVFQPH